MGFFNFIPNVGVFINDKFIPIAHEHTVVEGETGYFCNSCGLRLGEYLTIKRAES